MGRTAIDITGNRYGRVLVSHREGLSSGSATWRCKCDCGNEFVTFGGNLRKGDTTSCGCYRSEVTIQRFLRHGHLAGTTPEHKATTKTYRCWTNMLSRCNNTNVPAWEDYGGRGITVCERWRSFENFLADMGEAPAGLTIDRIDNSKGYEPGNCRWATMSEQNRNRRPFGGGSKARATHDRLIASG